MKRQTIALAVALAAGCGDEETSTDGVRTAAGKPAAAALQIVDFTAGDAGFRASSYLVHDGVDGVLVDAQFTRTEARNLAERVRSTGVELKAIFVTHGHPDHYFGAETLRQAFPGVPLVASEAVIADIQATGAAKLAEWKPLYGEDLTDTVPVPAPVEADQHLTVGGAELALVELGAGESEHGTALHLPGQRALLAGDLLYSGVHPWLAEGRPDAWLANLDRIASLGTIDRIYPGHGAPGDASLIQFNRDYIATYARACAHQGATAGSVEAALTSAYPELALPVIAKLSARACAPDPAGEQTPDAEPPPAVPTQLSRAAAPALGDEAIDSWDRKPGDRPGERP
jgi:glyoxylase-like metal-dependent hydrolase (beta-lactamase superfamily II)